MTFNRLKNWNWGHMGRSRKKVCFYVNISSNIKYFVKVLAIGETMSIFGSLSRSRNSNSSYMNLQFTDKVRR